MNKLEKEILVLNTLLAKERRKNKVLPVIGDGNLDAGIIFIGEAPGKNESLTGKPFCGASGKVLDGLLEHIGLNRENIYITNVVKDRPTDNRDPNTEDIQAYSPFLDRQLEIIKPKVVVTLGRFSMEYMMDRYDIEKDTISNVHGKVFNLDNFIFIPLYHPAVGIYNRKRLPELEKDFEILKRLTK